MPDSCFQARINANIITLFAFFPPTTFTTRYAKTGDVRSITLKLMIAACNIAINHILLLFSYGTTNLLTVVITHALHYTTWTLTVGTSLVAISSPIADIGRCRFDCNSSCR